MTPVPGARPRILIADDEQSMREWLRILFQRDGFDVLLAEDGVVAREIVRREFVDIILTDIRMPRLDGVGLLEEVRSQAPDTIVCMMTAHWTEDSEEWLAAQRLGAAALLEKPFHDVTQVTLQVRQLIDARRVRHERDVLRHALDDSGFAGIIGRSAPMLEVFHLVDMICRTNSTVLITGESGTGKELVARAIHDQSLRAAQPFVAVNCSALPETLLETELFGHVRGAFTGAAQARRGLVETAEKGTLFLDEIGEMTPLLQVKLLRVLQERTYRRVGESEERGANLRVIAATNRDLEKAVAEERFREDLFYRLNVIPIRLPALRERRDDVPLIAAHFLARFTREMGKPLGGFAPEAMALLEAYRWPGNVRELENVVERCVALERDTRIGVDTLPAPIREAVAAEDVQAAAGPFPGPGFRLEDHLREIERTHLSRALKQAGGVQTRAAELLGLTFRQFRYLAKKHGLRDRLRQED